MRFFNNLIQEITKEELEYQYIELNKSQTECAEMYEIPIGMFNRLLQYFNIHKDKKRAYEINRKVKAERYGDANYNNRNKAEQTCLDKYGVKNPFQDVDNIKKSYIEKLGVDHPMHDKAIAEKAASNHDYEASFKKASETYLQRTGYTNPSKNPEVIKKNIEVRTANGCFDNPHTSNEEIKLLEVLKNKFTAVETQYRDPRYARSTGYQYCCDFYLPEQDLFIELNAHFTHRDHPYNTDDMTDVDLAATLAASEKYGDQMIYETWAKRDPEKLRAAKTASLNYIMLYPMNTVQANIEMNNSCYSKLIYFLLNSIKHNKK